MRATIPAAAPFTAVAEDGRPVLEEWGTLVHVETDGDADRRRWTGVVSEVSQTDGGWDITVREFPGYFDGVPFEGLVRGVGEDPADVLAALVGDVQGWQNSWLNIDVRTDYAGAPQPLGTDLDDRIAAARAVVDAHQEAYDVVTKTKNDGTKATQDLAETLSDEVEFARRLVTEAQQAVIGLIAGKHPRRRSLRRVRLWLLGRPNIKMCSLHTMWNSMRRARSSLARSCRRMPRRKPSMTQKKRSKF
ncbi:MAG: hypothetical protein IPQ22_17015 [Rhodoferax sp.]|nr:hypothetical protein [Rhodoferax sp.]